MMNRFFKRWYLSCSITTNHRYLKNDSSSFVIYLLLVLPFPRVLVVHPYGLQLAGQLQALGEGVLLSHEDLVSEAVAEAGQGELTFKELGHVVDPFLLGLGQGGGGIPRGGHGGRLAVVHPFVVATNSTNQTNKKGGMCN